MSKFQAEGAAYSKNPAQKQSYFSFKVHAITPSAGAVKKLFALLAGVCKKVSEKTFRDRINWEVLFMRKKEKPRTIIMTDGKREIIRRLNFSVASFIRSEILSST